MKPFALATVMQLAIRSRDTAARAVKLAQAHWLDARSHEARALQACERQRNGQAAALTDGLDGAALAALCREAQRLETQRQEAAARVAAAWVAWQAQRDAWQAAEGRVKAFEVLEARWRAQHAGRERRIEQRVLDEWATRNRLVAGGRAR